MRTNMALTCVVSHWRLYGPLSASGRAIAVTCILANASLARHGSEVIMTSIYAGTTDALLGYEIASVRTRRQFWHSQDRGHLIVAGKTKGRAAEPDTFKDTGWAAAYWLKPAIR